METDRCPANWVTDQYMLVAAGGAASTYGYTLSTAADRSSMCSQVDPCNAPCGFCPPVPTGATYTYGPDCYRIREDLAKRSVGSICIPIPSC